MAVGIGTSRGQIDSSAGSLVQQLERTFTQMHELKTFLDATTDAVLTDQNGVYKYTQAEVDILKSAYADLATVETDYFTNLWNIQE
jgi:hypothetical protein